MSDVRCPMSRIPRARWLVLFLVLCGTSGFGAESPNAADIGHRTSDIGQKFAVDLTAAANSVNIGDSLVVTVTYRWPAGWTVVAPNGEPDPAKDFANAFVTNLPPPQKQSSGQEERRVYTITLSATRDGAWELPRPTLTVQTPEGPRSAVAPVVLVQVGADDKPAQLPPARKAWTRARGPGDDPRTWWAVGVVAVSLIGFIALVILRRRQQLTVRTPWEQFLDDWQATAAVTDGKEAGARLSLALRRCLGTVFRFDGPASTTRETALFLRGRLLDDEHRDLVRLLESLDALRWAPEDLPPSAVRPLIEMGRAWGVALKFRLDAEAELARSAPTAAKTTANATSESA